MVKKLHNLNSHVTRSIYKSVEIKSTEFKNLKLYQHIRRKPKQIAQASHGNQRTTTNQEGHKTVGSTYKKVKRMNNEKHQV